MAAVLVSAGKLYSNHEGEMEEILWISPATMDSADTVDFSTLVDNRTIVNVEGFDQTTGDNVTVTNSSSTITVDAAGSTTDHTYSVILKLLR